MKSPKIYTSKDVAKIAGVSQSTVSRVFSGNMNVSALKRDKVLKAAKEVSYYPNAIARSLTSRKTRLVGIVMRNIRNPFYSAVLEIFYSRFADLGYHLIFVNSESEIVDGSEIVKLLEYNVAGVIVSDATLSEDAAHKLMEKGISVVLFNRYVSDNVYNAVYCDNYLSAREIANYLVGLGHKSFAFLSGPEHSTITGDRLRGFEEELRKHGKDRFVVMHGADTYESGYEMAKELMKTNAKVDCIFGGNDIIALGVMDAIRQAGLKVPDDISVIGFDNIRMTTWESYLLTTWEQPLEEMITYSVQILTDLIEKRTTKTKRLMLDGKLIVRNTVKRKSK